MLVPEDKVAAIVRSAATEEDLFCLRRELDATLRPYRGRMTADQIALLERQYLDRLMLTHDASEGIAAFIERRTPQWRNA